MTEKKDYVQQALGIPSELLPQHIAIIMDGNGRWARQHGLPRFEGHRQGAKTAIRIVEECSRLGIKYVTLYSFSTENWKRPKDEVDMLMHLCAEFLAQQQPKFMEHNVRIVHLGREQELPDFVVQTLRESTQLTANNTGTTLALALNYSSQVEITDAVRKIALAVAEGKLDPDRIDRDTIARNLYTTGIPDPGLLIRTAGEKRISNFLLWQLSYSEFYIAKVYWPDFKEAHLHRAIRSFVQRERRFGDVKPAGTTVPPSS